MEPWIGVDLDGTLAHYDGWVHPTVIGAPIIPMVGRVREWLAAGKDVRIFTARVCDPTSLPAIREWCILHLGQALPVTNVKDLGMIELWDDRCYRVVTNRGIVCCDYAATRPTLRLPKKKPFAMPLKDRK